MNLNRTLTALTLLLAALAGNGCTMLQAPPPVDKPNASQAQNRATGAAKAATGGMCMREGESCNAKGATCCASLLCVGIGDSVCMQGY